MKQLQRINNIQDLRAEIIRLQVRRREQEAYLSDQYHLLKRRVNTPFEFLQRVTSSVPGAGLLKSVTSSIGKAMKNKDADWLTRALQLGAPLVLNSTVLRKAGWLKKALVLLASETAVGQLNQDKVNGLLQKITTFVRPSKKKKKEKKQVASATEESPMPGDDLCNGA